MAAMVESGHCLDAIFEEGTVRPPREYGIVLSCDPGLPYEQSALAQKLGGQSDDREALNPRIAASGLDDDSD